MAKQTRPTAAPKASARPNTPAVTRQDSKSKRVTYPNLPDTGLESIPEDFDHSLHLPLKRTDFKAEHIWFEMRADELERKAAQFRRQAELSRKLGNKEDRAKAKRLAKINDQLAQLRAELEAAGHNPDDLLSALNMGGSSESDDE